MKYKINHITSKKIIKFSRHAVFSLLLAPVLMLLIGCSTSSSDKNSYSIKEINRKFASEMSSVSAEKITAGQCPQSHKIQQEIKWKSLVTFANHCIAQQQWLNVEMIGERLNELEPAAPWGSYFLSLSAENKNFKERALWMIDLAIKKSPDTALLKYQKGRILWSLEFYKDAIIEIKKAAQTDKNLKDAHVFLGQVYLRELNFKESIKSFENALLLDVRDKDSLTGIASCYIELEKSENALSYIEKGISSYPRSLDFRLHEIYVYENIQRQNEIALLKYKQLLNLVAQKKIDGIVPLNLELKIKTLENSVQKNPSKLAQQQ